MDALRVDLIGSAGWLGGAFADALLDAIAHGLAAVFRKSVRMGDAS
jgi:hypothetical protein